MPPLRRLAKASPGRLGLLVGALTYLSLVWLGLRLLPFRRVRAAVTCRLCASAGRRPRASVTRIVWAVDSVTALVPVFRNCLTRAIATQLLLARCGHPASMRIGVTRSEGGEFKAHAWIEYRGRVILGWMDDLARYTPLGSVKGLLS